MSKDTIHLFNNLAVKGLVANGFVGSSGQALLSNGTGVYWGSGAGFTGSKGDKGADGVFGGAAFDYTFSTATTLADPGDGVLKLNNTVFNDATTLIIHDNDDNGVSVYNFLQTIDDSTSAIKGHFTVTEKSNTTNFAQFSIVGNHVDAANSFQIPVAYLTGATSMTNGLDIIITFARTGDKGDTGFTGSFGYTGSQGDIGYTGSRGATGFVGSQGYTGSQGDIGYVGSQGVIGYTGSAGFTGSASTVAGPLGYTGSQGIGYTGSQGTTGYVGSASTEAGPIGYTGSAGAGYTGSKGDIGYTGSKGDIGYTGSKGDIGYTGSKGDIGYTGSQGDGGPQGLIGYTGSKGDIGYTGSAGPIGGSNTQVIFNDSGVANGSSSFVFDKTTGNVGIGTASPGAKLSVVTSSSAGSTLGNWTNSHVSIGPNVGTVSGSGLGFGYNTSADQAEIVSIAPGVSWKPLTLLSAGIRFNSASGGETMRIGTDGYLGIGTTSAIRPLHAFYNSAVVGAYTAVLQGAAGGYGAGISFQSQITGGAVAEMARITADGDNSWNTTASTQDASLRFYTTLDGTLAEKMRIDSAGNVGIGTASPSGYGKLAVIGNIASSTDGATVLTMRANAGATNLGSYNATGSSLAFQTNASGAGEAERMRITSSGNIGIGTTDPRTKLEVTTAIMIPADGGYYGGGAYWDSVSAWRNTNSSQGGWVIRNTSGELAIHTAPSPGVAGTAFSSFSERVRIDSSGNVGIGTSSPTTKLQIAENTGTSGVESGFSITNTIDSNLFMQVSGTASTDKRVAIYTSTATSMAFGTNNSERMRISAAGDVGIGTSSPVTKMEVSTNTGTEVFQITQTDATGGTVARMRLSHGSGTQAVFQVGSGYSTIGLTTSGPLAFITNNAERMRIDSSGNIGIGTNSPTSKLQVYNNVANTPNIVRSETGASGNTFDYAAFGVVAPGATGGLVAWANGSARANQVWVQSDGAYPLILGTNDTERMRITTGGYVGIGATSPEAVLTVFNATTFNARTSGINIHRPSAYGQYGSFAYDGDTTYFSTTYTGGGAGVYGKFIFQAYDSTSTPVQRMTIDNSGSVIANVDMRAPIFYDSNNTAFFFDGDGSTNINTLTGNGKTAIETADGYLRINQGNAFGNGIWTGSSNFLNSGGIFGWGSNGGTTTSRVYINGGTYNGTNVIAIDGTSGTIWTRGQIQSNEGVSSTTNNAGSAVFRSSFAGTGQYRHSIVTRHNSSANTDNAWDFYLWRPEVAAGTEATHRAFVIDGAAGTTSTIASRAPIFYDSNNTACYVDPESGSVLGGQVLFAGGTKVATNGDVYARRDAGTTGVYYFADGGSKYLYHDGTNYNFGSAGVVITPSSFRAPIFYDSDNTGYYTDPNASSRMASLSLDTALVTSGITGLTTAAIQIAGTYNIGTTPSWMPMTHQRAVHDSGYITHLNTGLYKHNATWGSGISGWYAAIGGSDTSPTEAWYLTYGGLINHTYGYVTTSNSFRAPIFYDSNDTAYYINPNDSQSIRTVGDWRSNSSDWTGEFSGKIQYHANNWYFQSASEWIFRRSDAVTAFNVTQGGFGTFLASIRVGSGAASSDIYMGDSDNGERRLHCNSDRIGFLTQAEFWGSYCSDNGDWTTEYIGYALASSRAPIFYDYNNTAYLFDGDGTSRWNISSQDSNHVFNQCGVGVVGSYDSTKFQTVFAMGSSYNSNAAGTSITGAYGLWWSHPNAGGQAATLDSHGLIAVINGANVAQLGRITSAVASMRAPIFYDLDNTGYYCNPDNTSNFLDMYVQGGFGGTSNNAAYTYAAIEVRERGFGGAQDDTWATAPRLAFHWGGRVASQIGMSSSGRITILNNPGTAAEVFECGNFYAPIFYDSNDTAYSVDPTGTSRTGLIRADYYGRAAHNTGFLRGGYNNIGASEGQTSPIYCIGSSYEPGTTTLGIMYGIGFTSGGSFFPSGASGWGMYTADNGVSRIFLSAASGDITATGNITAYASDRRLKTNIKPISNAIDKLMRINGVEFDWVDNIQEIGFIPQTMHETGVIAQEIQAVIPDAVKIAPFNKNATDISGIDNEYLTVDKEKIIPLLIEAIKEQQARINRLEETVNNLMGNK